MLPPDRSTSCLPVMLIGQDNSLSRRTTLKLALTHLLSSAPFFSL